MLKRNFYFILLIGVFFACKNANKTDYPVLSVNLSQMNTPSLFDIFEKIEIIPLETTDSSLIGGPANNIEFYNSHYYIFDGPTESLYCFDEHGKFVRKIGNKGPGPQEYIFVTDFVINNHNDVVELLSPFGFLYVYELSGKFVGRTKLPNIVPNYQEIMLLNDSLRILMSSTESNQDQLYVYSTRSNTIINSFYKENPAIFDFNPKSFYQYNGSIYFYKPLISKVFKVNQHGYEVAYSWNFGALNPERTKLDKDVTNERLEDMFKNSQIKGIYNCQYQNDNYYYTRYNRIVNQDLYDPLYTNVIYDKRNNKAFVFEKFKEDLYFFPTFWDNDYVLSASHIYIKKSVDPSVLDEENRNKLKAIKEDDNPFIIKYYFKK